MKWFIRAGMAVCAWEPSIRGAEEGGSAWALQQDSVSLFFEGYMHRARVSGVPFMWSHH